VAVLHWGRHVEACLLHRSPVAWDEPQPGVGRPAPDAFADGRNLPGMFGVERVRLPSDDDVLAHMMGESRGDTSASS